MISQDNNQFIEILEKYSKLSTLVRVIAYCHRVLMKTKPKERWFSSNELKKANETCIRLTQNRHFYNEINTLQKKKRLENYTKLLQLNPFLDSIGLLRVGGRLQHSELSFDTKHPYILPSDCKFSELIIRDTHERTLHGGSQLMLGTIRQQYWIIHAQNIVKKFVHNCIRFYRQRPQVSQQLMGSLPSVRVRPTRPFYQSGIDFAGPIKIKWSNGRGVKTVKAYIALFISLSTKAIHLELVSDLTTEACIAAIKRFVSREDYAKTSIVIVEQISLEQTKN